VLDVACGPSGAALLLAREYSARVDGVDLYRASWQLPGPAFGTAGPLQRAPTWSRQFDVDVRAAFGNDLVEVDDLFDI
jgi:hypothetical protein